ncbi:MAG TPA: hypothetical protein VFF25_02775 [Clostridia bacterium]|nr:hypothetical protein [Clostridia bacterium]
MKLYNCESKVEMMLKKINLELLLDNELIELADNIRNKFREDVLQDECIVVDALHQIVEEQARRLMDLRLKLIKNG